MATIDKSGIQTNNPIQASHITNIIDALDGTTATDIVVKALSATGSVLGTSSFAITASYALNGGGGGSGTPGGSTNDFQYKIDGSTFGGAASLTYVSATQIKASGSFTGSFSGSFFGTSSVATTAGTASFANKTAVNLASLAYPGGGGGIVIASAAGNLTASIYPISASITDSGLGGKWTAPGNDYTSLIDLAAISSNADPTATKGFCIPVQTPGPVSPATIPTAGSMIFNQSTNRLWIYNGSTGKWIYFSGSSL